MSDTLDTRVRGVEIEQAKQEVIVSSLAVAVKENTSAILELTAVLNKSKGAGWMLWGLAAAVGWLMSILAEWVRNAN